MLTEAEVRIDPIRATRMALEEHRDELELEIAIATRAGRTPRAGDVETLAVLKLRLAEGSA